MVFRLRCELNLIAFAMMVSALKSDFFGRFCHSWHQSNKAYHRVKFNLKKIKSLKLLTTKVVFAKCVGSLRIVLSP